MPIASVVVTLDPRDGLRQAALARLVGDPHIDLGQMVGSRVPAVVDTESASEGEELVASPLVTPGILGVDVVRIDFEVDEERHESP